MTASVWPQWNVAEIQAMRLRMSGAYRGFVPKQLEWYGLHNMNCVVWLLEAGQCRIETAQGTMELIPGHWAFQMPGLHLNQIFAPGSRLISIRFQLLWSSGRSLFYAQEVHSCSDDNARGLKQAALGLLRYAPSYADAEALADWQPDQVWARDVAERHFLSCWYRCVCNCGFVPQAEHLADKRVRHAINLLQGALQERDVPYALLHRELLLSRAQLDRIFMDQLGHSPKREHDLLRLAHARQELQETDRAIKQIASDIGFHDASQFTKWFRRLDGRSPRQARSPASEPI